MTSHWVASAFAPQPRTLKLTLAYTAMILWVVVVLASVSFFGLVGFVTVVRHLLGGAG